MAKTYQNMAAWESKHRYIMVYHISIILSPYEHGLLTITSIPELMTTWWLIPLRVNNPNYKWINPTYPIYNWGYISLTNWDEPPSIENIS